LRSVGQRVASRIRLGNPANETRKQPTLYAAVTLSAKAYES
jgi:hypothetical protein